MDNSDLGDKKPKSYYVDFHKRNDRSSRGRHNHSGNARYREAPELNYGHKGFLITSIDEVKSYLEMRFVLEGYYNQLYSNSHGNTQDVSTDANTTTEDEIESELKHLRREKPFKQVKTFCRNTLFINITKEFLHIDPNVIVDKFFDDLEVTKSTKTSNTYKVIPIVDTFRASPSCAKEAVSNILRNSFEDQGESKSFFIEVQNRGNYKLTSEDKQKMIEATAEAVSSARPNWRVSRDNVDYMLVLVLLKNVCCVSILKDYFKRSKYNVTKFTDTSLEEDSCEPKQPECTEETSKKTEDENLS